MLDDKHVQTFLRFAQERSPQRTQFFRVSTHSAIAGSEL
jgi:hypothetical protein